MRWPSACEAQGLIVDVSCARWSCDCVSFRQKNEQIENVECDQSSDPEARVWRGSDLPFEKEGIKILGTPFGHPQFVEAHLNKKIVEHEVLLERIPTVPDLQSAWLLSLRGLQGRTSF